MAAEAAAEAREDGAAFGGEAASAASADGDDSLWQLLPSDVRTRILCCLGAADVRSTALVCRHWRAVSADGSLWRTLVARDLPYLDLDTVVSATRGMSIADRAADHDADADYRQFYIAEVRARREARQAGVVIGSGLHTALFRACGKIPDVPRVASLRPLLASREFCGDADAYLDGNGSSLLMYCIGPANEETVPMVRLLGEHGARATLKNSKGETAMAYAKAWQRSGVAAAPARDVDATLALYAEVITVLSSLGCDPDEPAAF